jgi:serine phosphatase RsbU (regulator of sigma subunit)/pSer/pThr/pTyr-binding forkhead associated (FHA) protein
MFALRIEPAVGEPFDHKMEEESLVIGRASESELVIADRFLSRKHARLFRQGDRLFVEDLGSRNGTLLNDSPVEGTAEVHQGDRIKVSGSIIRIGEEAGSRDDTDLLDSRGLGDMTVIKHASEVLKSASSTTGESLGEDALRGFASRLQLLNEVHGALSRSIELDELLELILERAFEHLRPEEGAIFLKTDGEEEYRLAARRSTSGGGDYLYSRTLVREVADKGLAAVVLDAQTDERFAQAQSIMASGVRSLVAAPLLDPEGCLGIIVLNSRLQVRQFSEADMDLLISLASVAALRIRNVALAEEAAERREMARELELARRIQVALLPDALPEIPGYEVHGGNIPSRGVSGDFYEIIGREDPEEFLALVADVSGKGRSASLLAAALEALVASPIEAGLAPEQIVRRASGLLYQRTPPERYAVAVLVALEPHSGNLRFVNAGSVPGLLIRSSGEVEMLDATGAPIGLLPKSDYTAGTNNLDTGDLLVLYTDGVNEAENSEEDQYGIERLVTVCRDNLDRSLVELAAAIEEDLSLFAGDVPFADDRTTVLIRRLSS